MQLSSHFTETKSLLSKMKRVRFFTQRPARTSPLPPKSDSSKSQGGSSRNARRLALRIRPPPRCRRIFPRFRRARPPPWCHRLVCSHAEYHLTVCFETTLTYSSIPRSLPTCSANAGTCSAKSSRISGTVFFKFTAIWFSLCTTKPPFSEYKLAKNFDGC